MRANFVDGEIVKYGRLFIEVSCFVGDDGVHQGGAGEGADEGGHESIINFIIIV